MTATEILNKLIPLDAEFMQVVLYIIRDEPTIDTAHKDALKRLWLRHATYVTNWKQTGTDADRALDTLVSVDNAVLDVLRELIPTPDEQMDKAMEVKIGVYNRNELKRVLSARAEIVVEYEERRKHGAVIFGADGKRVN